MKDAYNRAVADVLARTEYGVRVEKALAPAHEASWSNNSRRWIVNRARIIKGQEVRLDANEILIYGTIPEATKIASHLPAHPLDSFSTEARERGPEQFLSNPRKPSPEEEWMREEEGSGEVTSPEGDVPPWSSPGYEGEFPMQDRIFYVNAYVVTRKEDQTPTPSYEDNLEKMGYTTSVGKFPQGLEMGTDFDYQPFASIPVRHEDKAKMSFFVKYLRRTAERIPSEFLKIVVENKYPQGSKHYDENGRLTKIEGEVVLPDGRWFTFQVIPPFKHEKIGYIEATVGNRMYGGSEEGGWYYDASNPVAAIPYIHNGEHTVAKLEEYLQHTIGYTSPYPLGSVLGHDVLNITTRADSFPVEYPLGTPRYE